MNDKRHSISVMYLFAFFFSLHSALPAYINSTYLSQFASSHFVGIIYSIGSVLTILAFFGATPLLRRFGNYKVTMSLITVELVALVSLAYFTFSPVIIYISFIVSFITVALIGFGNDVFLESFSSNEKTGNIRGWFLTSSNIAWVIAPTLGALILNESHYANMYYAAGLLMIPAFYLLHENLRTFKDPVYPPLSFSKSVVSIFNNADLRNIFTTSFFLQFFYAWMVIYMPLYLHDHMHFDVTSIGIMFSIILLPFIILEEPLGRIADNLLGEKEILVLGFLIIAVSTGALSFIDTPNIYLWTLILFTTRIGASMVEIMTETYFFKKVSTADIGVMSVFRTMRPLAYVVSPLLATLFLSYFDLKYLFVTLGCVTLLAIREGLAITDTK